MPPGATGAGGVELVHSDLLSTGPYCTLSSRWKRIISLGAKVKLTRHRSIPEQMPGGSFFFKPSFWPRILHTLTVLLPYCWLIFHGLFPSFIVVSRTHKFCVLEKMRLKLAYLTGCHVMCHLQLQPQPIKKKIKKRLRLLYMMLMLLFFPLQKSDCNGI